MKNSDKNINSPGKFEKQTDAFFEKAKIPYLKSKEEIWQQLEDRMTNSQTKEIPSIKKYRAVLAVAASIILLAGVFSIVRFYTNTIKSQPGQHLTVNLSDGSTVILNAESSLSYQPLWWQFSGEVQFEGEGFFEVEKGKKFTVRSSTGKTEVLGTSFNIQARNDIYEVSCKTGKVKVTSPKNDEAILGPGYSGRINEEGKVVVFKPEKPENTISWIDNKFIFTATPFTEVIHEIARQYAVDIRLQEDVEYFYTGYFTKDIPVEQVLELVCKPFGLTFVAKQNGSYEVVKK